MFTFSIAESDGKKYNTMLLVVFRSLYYIIIYYLLLLFIIYINICKELYKII